MIRKMAIRKWIGAGALTLFCAVMGGAFLWMYGAAALEGLSGSVPELAKTQSMDNIYFGAVMGLIAVALAVIIIIRQSSLSVGGQIKRYLANHPDVTMEQLEDDFASAVQYGSIWIGNRWTFSYDLVGLVFENAKIAWVYSERDGGRSVQYFLCLGTTDGKIVKTSVKQEHLVPIKGRYTQFPHILLDNSMEYEHIFKNDINAFLNIRYNQNIQ